MNLINTKRASYTCLMVNGLDKKTNKGTNRVLSDIHGAMQGYFIFISTTF